MATVGNLFVNIGASTQGLEKGTQKARSLVKSLKSDISGSLSNIPGLGGILGPIEKVFQAIQGVAGKSKTATASAKDAVAAIEREATKGVERVASLQTKLTAATAQATKAQGDLNAGAKYSKMLFQQRDIEGTLSRIKDRVAAATAEYKKAQEQVVKSASSVAVDGANQRQYAALERLTALARERVRVEKELSAVASKTGRTKSVLESRGVTIGRDGGVDRAALQKAADSSQSVVSGLQTKLGEAKGVVAGLQSKLDGAKSAVKEVGRLAITSGAGVAFLAGGMVAATASAIGLTIAMAKQASELNDQAIALGISSSALTGLRDSMAMIGVPAGVAESSMQKLQIELENALEGSEDAADKFKRLGIDINSLNGKDAAQALEVVLGKVRQLGTQGAKIKSLRDLFGRGGIGMAAAVNATATELAEANTIAASLKLPDSMISGLDQTSDRVDAMYRAFDNLKMMFASAFGPAVKDMADSLREMMSSNFDGMMGGLQAVALTLAVVVDLVAAVANIFRVVFNIVQSLAGLVNGVFMLAWYGILKVIQAIVYAVEFLARAGHDVSGAIGDAASIAFETAKESAKSAGTDAVEAFGAAIDAVVPNASIAVVQGIAKGYENAKATVETNPLIPKVDNKEATKRLEDLGKMMDDLRLEASQLGMTDDQKKLGEMQRLGASPAQLAEAQALQEKIALFNKQQKIAEDVKGIMDDLQQQADTALMTEKEKLVYKLKQAGADQKAINDALLLTGAIGERTQLAEGQKAWGDFMKGLDKSLLDATTSREQQIRRLAEAAGLLGKDLDDAVTKAMEMESAIAAAEKAKKDQEDIASTLSNLQDEVRKSQIGDVAFEREKLAEKGATDAQLQQFDQLQAQLALTNAKPDEAQSMVQSFDTAFGQFKFAGDQGDQMLSESVAQTDLLTRIATATESAAVARQGAAGATSAMATDGSMQPVMVEANRYLAQIAQNTAAFAGVLN